MPLIPRLLLTLFKAIWKNMLQIMLLVKHYLELFYCSLSFWACTIFQTLTSKAVYGVHVVYFNGVGMTDHGMYTIQCAEDKTHCAQMLTHSLVTKFRNLQDLGSCTILCYLPWSPWKQCCPPLCNSQSGLQPEPNTSAYVIIFSITWQATLKRESHCCDT